MKNKFIVLMCICVTNNRETCFAFSYHIATRTPCIWKSPRIAYIKKVLLVILNLILQQKQKILLLFTKISLPPPKTFQKFANTLPHSGIRERIHSNMPPFDVDQPRTQRFGVTWHVPLKIIVRQLVGGSHFGA